MSDNIQNKKNAVSFTIALSVYLLIGGLLILNFPQEGYNDNERQLFITLLVSYFIIMGFVVAAILNRNIYIFEPFSFITLLYVGIFILRPIQDLYTHSVSYAGRNLVDSGVKSTILFTVGYIFFYIGYFMKKNYTEPEKKLLKKEYPDMTGLLVTMWAFFFICCIICQFSQGFSLRYIFSLGSSGEREINSNNSLLLFLSNFATSLLVVWIMIIVKSKNDAVKIVITALTVVYLIMRNSRWLMLILILAPITYFYTKRNKSPKIAYLLSAGFVALVLFAWMQLNRYNIAMGRTVQGLGEEGLTFQFLMSPFDSDLTTYTTFYGMVGNFPDIHPYMLGRTFLYMFVLFVPRFLWPSKPDNPVRDMVENSLGSVARINGRAVANIGEFYANFGIIGIIILMFVFGYIVSRLKHLYKDPSENRLIIYSVLYPLMFQWVARGNFSSNFYYTLFAFIPFIVQYIFINSVRRKR